jgi:NADP-dependent 3-hydroxy acid dehydrogenase YdfG
MAAKAIFITGGASGIGLATAKLFAGKGWFVGLADINAGGLEAAKGHFTPGMVSTHVLDVRDKAAWGEALADFAAASGGRMDAFLNNAGIAVGGPLQAMELADVDRAVGINLLGVIYGAKAAFPLLKATPGSAMLITSSAAGIYGSAGMSIFAATKFGVRGFAESLNGEWQYDDVFAGTIMPSFIDTPLLDQSLPGANHSVRQSVSGAGLEITPVSEVAEAVWKAVQTRKRIHTQVGKTAHRLWFMAKWMPGTLRKVTGKRIDRLE